MKGKGVKDPDMLKAMSPEAMTTMTGDSLPNGFLENLNAKLNQIDVVE